MGKDWINENGDVVHSNALQGAGGTGSFKSPKPLGRDVELHGSLGISSVKPHWARSPGMPRILAMSILLGQT
jgi:hypothetical protein